MRAPRRAHYAYNHPDLVGKQDDVNLMYDVDEDVVMTKNDGVLAVNELDGVLSIQTRTRCSPPGTMLQPAATRNLSSSLLDSAQLRLRRDNAPPDQTPDNHEISLSARTDHAGLEREQDPSVCSDLAQMPRDSSSPVAASNTSSPSSASTVLKNSYEPVEKLVGLEQSKHATTASPTHSPFSSANPNLRPASPPSFGFKFSIPLSKSAPRKPIANALGQQQASRNDASFHARARPLVSYDDLYDDRPERRAKEVARQDVEMKETITKEAEQSEDDRDKSRAIPLFGSSSKLADITSSNDGDDEIEDREVDGSPSKKARHRMDIIRGGEQVIEMLDY